MRVDKQTVTYLSLDEREYALLIDIVEHLANVDADVLADVIGEDRRTTHKYQLEVRELCNELGGDVQPLNLTTEEVNQLNEEARKSPPKDYGPFVKRND